MAGLRPVPVQRAAQLSDGRVAQIDQVAGDQAGAVALIDHDRGDVLAQAGVDQHQGGAAAGGVQLVGVAAADRGDGHDPVDMPAGQPLDGVAEALHRQLGDGGEDQVVAGGLGGALDVEQHLQRAVVGHAEGNDGDGLRAAGDQTLGRPVGVVLKLLDGHQDSFAGFLGHIGMAVDHP